MAVPSRNQALCALISCAFYGQFLFSAEPSLNTVAFATGNAKEPVFIENKGQFDQRVRYQVRVHSQTVWLTNNGLTFDVVRPKNSDARPDNTGFPEVERFAFRAEFTNCLKSVSIEHLDTVPGNYNFLAGDLSHSRSNVHGYSGVVYRGLWRGIDLRVC